MKATIEQNTLSKGLKFKCIKDIVNPSGYGFFAKVGDIVECYDDGWLINSNGVIYHPYRYTVAEYVKVI